MEHKDVNCQEEHHSNRNHPMQDQNDGVLVQDHAEQAGGEGKDNQRQQKVSLRVQLFPADHGMDGAEKQEKNGCQLVEMDAGQGNQESDDETDQQSDIQELFHALAASWFWTEMVLTPKRK